MTDSPLSEILAAGEHALEYTHGRLDELSVQEIVDVVGRAVLHAAAEKQRDGDGARIDYGEPICNCPDLIDPAKQEQP